MAWVKLDDGFPQHPKVVEAGHKAAWLYICSLTYSSSQLTNGHIPRALVGRLTDIPGEKRLAQRLVEVGLWEHTEEGFVIHDYGDYQRTREQVQEQRAAAKRRMADWRKAHEGSPNGSK